jgi:putative DNA primase/helicase
MSAHLRSWAAALGGTISGASISCPGPGHSRKDRSLSVTPTSIASPAGFLVYSHAGDDPISCLDYVRAQLGMPAFAPQGRPPAAFPKLSHEALSATGAASQRASEPAPGTNPNTDLARKIWREAVDIRSTLAEKYLASRGFALDYAEDWHRVLRFHPTCPFGADRAPAMIALMRDFATDEPRCIQRTRLTADGIKIERQMLGPSKGAAIKIDPDADVTRGLCIGEGLETCLSGRVMGLKPVWALGSAGAIANFPLLPGIEGLHIFLENDEANQRASKVCADLWLDAGCTVLTAAPVTGSDLNDELRTVAS